MKKNVREIYALSPMQEGMLYHCMNDENDGNYHIQQGFWYNGDINIDYVRQALYILAIKYEVLKTAFAIPKSTGKPWQVILDDREIELIYEGISCQSEDCISEIIQKDLERGFNVFEDSLVRLTVVSFSLNRHYMLWSSHHIIVDGWCNSMILQEFLKLYSKLSAGLSVYELEDIVKKESCETARYSEYIKWLENQNNEEALVYWKRLIDGYDSVASIPSIRRPSGCRSQVEVVECIIEENVSQQVLQICKNNNITVNTYLESAWGILLQKYNNIQEVVFGKVVSGRDIKLKGIEKMMGLFINTIPVKIQSENEMTVQQMLMDVHSQSLQSSKYEHISLADIQSMNCQVSQLIHTLFVFENFTQNTSDMEVESTQFAIEANWVREQNNYPITIRLYMINGNIAFDIMYNPNLYSQEDIEELIKRYKYIVKQMSTDSSQNIEKIELCSPEELGCIINQFNDTETPYPSDKTIVQLFEEQVERIPDEIAAIDENGTLTYRELNRKANALGKRLRELGVGRNEYVAIVADRGLKMLEGIYSIIKSGGAYVPVDPNYPKDRIQYMIEDCNPKAILVHSETVDVGMFGEVPVLNLSDENLFEGGQENLELINVPEDTLYVIYTSGTTGHPKGVMNKNNSLINRILWMNSRYPLGEEDTILQKTTYTFDVSVWEIIWWSIVGAKVVLLAPGGEKEADKICQTIEKHRVTVMHFVPSMLNVFLNYVEEHREAAVQLGSLKYVFASGEALKSNQVRAFNRLIRKVHPQSLLINLYGPTEAAIDVTYFECDEDYERIPIGKPIDNTRIYIMQKDSLCGIGIPGELCITGVNVAKGYLNREELTAEKFTSNPYGEGKMYHTGDLARWLPDGNIEYLGRIDDQVKVRGFRIELGEIEAVIRKIEAIKDCAVIVKKDAQGEPNICAYVVAEHSLDVSQIKCEIGKDLTDYMIPAYIMQIDQIPVTHNGKLDRRALPDIIVQSKKEYKVPCNETEEKICAVFEEVLGAIKVGANDDFFELGGHSLRATRLVNRLEAETGVRIPLKVVFEEKTVEKLAQYILRASNHEYEVIPKAEKKAYYPMSSAQKRIFLVSQMDITGIAYNMPNTIEMVGNIDETRLKDVAKQLVKRHEILRTSLMMKEGDFFQEIHDNVTLEVVIVEGRECELKQIYEDFVQPFDLAKAPLMRVQLVKLENRNLLFFDMHHSISDGASMNIVQEEFMKLYQGESLSELERQYKDYSEWMGGRDLSVQESYWLNEFGDAIPVMDLPTDYPRPNQQSFKGDAIDTIIHQEKIQRIRELAQQTGATEYMIFLSVLMITLSKYTRQEDVVIGSPISGRMHQETEQMLGMFVNTLAMRGRPEANKAYLAFLEEIKQTALKAYENQEYPFEDLVEKVDVERDMSRNPLFDVMFVLQNNESVENPYVDIQFKSGVDIEETIAKFDLTFCVVPKEKDYVFEVVYCKALYKKDSVQRLIEHFNCILDQILEHPEQLIKSYEMITSNERNIILNEFNQTHVDYQRKTVVELFEDQVEKTPDAIAVIHNSTRKTYKELNSMLNGLAKKLREQGIKPNDFVAVKLERGIEMVVALLGIIKAGAAYVPIDPSYPCNRVDYILDDCRAKAIICSEMTQNELDTAKYKVFKIEDVEPCENNLERVNTSQDLAYVIYTSGTTGTPKGVLINHNGLVNMSNHLKEMYKVTEQDVVLQFANYVFDASVWEMALAFYTGQGATLCLIDSDIITEPNLIHAYIEQNQVSLALLPPQYYAQMSVKGLRILTTGGSATDKSILSLAAKNGVSQYINAYGPTENTVLATHWVWKEGMEIPHRIPIGKPMVNTQVYVMNQDSLCGIGVLGELCISGEGLAQGYLNLAELTAESFVDNPFGMGKMYRTGDLVRWLPTGDLEYWGRIDEQVKIRGFRIELGEIESVMRKIDEIVDCAVIVKENDAKEKMICAFYVTNTNIQPNNIKVQLSYSLPEYMIPNSLVELDEIPTNNSGKVDRKALSLIETDVLLEYVEPQSELETMLCEIFAQVLGYSQVGVTDNFFELGGDSIKAIRIISIMREKGYEVSVADIMKLKTVACIAMNVKESESLAYEQGEVVGTVCSTPIIEEFERWKLKNPHHFNQSIMVNISTDDEALIKTILREIVIHHDILRAVYRDKELTILNSDESKLYDFYSYDLRNKVNEEKEIEKLCNIIQSSINIETGPMVKAALFKTDKGNYLMICIHHLVIDGVSWRILVEDFQTALQQLNNNEPINLPLKTASYIDWSRALKEYKESYILEDEKSYWSKVLEIMKEGVFEADSTNETHQYDTVRISLNEELTTQLVTEAGKIFNTNIIEVLLCALGMAVNALTGQTRLSILLEGHGREEIHKRINIDRTLGWFTCIYPVVTECNDSVQDSIISVKEMMRKVPNKGISFGLLKEALQWPGDSAQISFNYLGEMGERTTESYTSGNNISEENRMMTPISFNGSIVQGELDFTIIFDQSKYLYSTIQSLGDWFIDKLIDIIHYNIEQEDEIKTMSDMSADDLSMEDLDLINDFF